MKIQGSSSPHIQSSKKLKKGRASGAFQSFLNTEIEGVQSREMTKEQPDMQQPSEQRWQLIEEVTALLDRALEQIAEGEKPDKETLNSIQQLRSQLNQQPGERDDQLHQADTILAVEAGRINTLNH